MHISLPRHAPVAGHAPALPRLGAQWLPAGVFLGALIFAGTTLLIAQTSIETAEGYEVARLEAAKNLAQQQNLRLEAEVAGLKSLDRIEQIAVEQLKMVKAKSYTYITVDMVPPSAAQTAQTLTGVAPEQRAPATESWWDQLLAGLSGQRRTQ